MYLELSAPLNVRGKVTGGCGVRLAAIQGGIPRPFLPPGWQSSAAGWQLEGGSYPLQGGSYPLQEAPCSSWLAVVRYQPAGEQLVHVCWCVTTVLPPQCTAVQGSQPRPAAHQCQCTGQGSLGVSRLVRDHCLQPESSHDSWILPAVTRSWSRWRLP